MNRSNVDMTQHLYMKSQEALVAVKVELQKSRTECARVTNDALTLRDQNRRLLDDQEQLTIARRDTEGKLRFRMRQVMELEQERTLFKSKEEELIRKVADLQGKLAHANKEVADTRTDMKVLSVKNQYMEEKFDQQSGAVSFDVFQRLEMELESLKHTVRDLTEVNRAQEKEMTSAQLKAERAHERAAKAEKTAETASANLQHIIASTHYDGPEVTAPYKPHARAHAHGHAAGGGHAAHGHHAAPAVPAEAETNPNHDPNNDPNIHDTTNDPNLNPYVAPPEPPQEGGRGGGAGAGAGAASTTATSGTAGTASVQSSTAAAAPASAAAAAAPVKKTATGAAVATSSKRKSSPRAAAASASSKGAGKHGGGASASSKSKSSSRKPKLTRLVPPITVEKEELSSPIGSEGQGQEAFAGFDDSSAGSSVVSAPLARSQSLNPPKPRPAAAASAGGPKQAAHTATATSQKKKKSATAAAPKKALPSKPRK